MKGRDNDCYSFNQVVLCLSDYSFSFYSFLCQIIGSCEKYRKMEVLFCGELWQIERSA